MRCCVAARGTPARRRRLPRLRHTARRRRAQRRQRSHRPRSWSRRLAGPGGPARGAHPARDHHQEGDDRGNRNPERQRHPGESAAAVPGDEKDHDHDAEIGRPGRGLRRLHHCGELQEKQETDDAQGGERSDATEGDRDRNDDHHREAKRVRDATDFGDRPQREVDDRDRGFEQGSQLRSGWKDMAPRYGLSAVGVGRCAENPPN